MDHARRLCYGLRDLVLFNVVIQLEREFPHPILSMLTTGPVAFSERTT